MVVRNLQIKQEHYGYSPFSGQNEEQENRSPTPTLQIRSLKVTDSYVDAYKNQSLAEPTGGTQSMPADVDEGGSFIPHREVLARMCVPESSQHVYADCKGLRMV